MGIHCELNMFKPPEDAFVPGGDVTGIIKYALDEETTFKRITVSLKGSGFLKVKDKSRKRRDKKFVYRNSEVYIDVDNVIQEDERGTVVPVGSYEILFNFKLPRNIPPTLNYHKQIPRYTIWCSIAYYVRIKFERPGLFKFAKHFKKNLTVVSGIIPKLPMEPIVYGERKKLFKLFSSHNNVIDIKAIIGNSIIKPGGKVEFDYEVHNDSSIIVKGVETKMIEVYTFKPIGHYEIKSTEHVKDTDTKTPSIAINSTQEMPVVIDLPIDKTSVEFSNLITRDYFIEITAELPMPHFNAKLLVPVQIGTFIDNLRGCDDEEPPPPYWEVMGEENDDESTFYNSDNE